MLGAVTTECDDCKVTISRKHNRGKTDTVAAMGVTEPGKAFTMDIIYNALEADYICEEDYPYFLLLKVPGV